MLLLYLVHFYSVLLSSPFEAVFTATSVHKPLCLLFSEITLSLFQNVDNISSWGAVGDTVAPCWLQLLEAYSGSQQIGLVNAV